MTNAQEEAPKPSTEYNDVPPAALSPDWPPEAVIRSSHKVGEYAVKGDGFGD